MTEISRRTLFGALAAGAAGCASQPKLGRFTAAQGAASAQFAQGVASGDPTADAVVIWTRATPQGPQATPLVKVSWQVATDADFGDVVRAGEVQTGPAQDWTVKVDVTGLEPGARYYYRFAVGAAVSETGRTRTLPAGSVETARFAVCSCTNYPFGYFNVYDHIARRDDLDAVIHLGDYIYEFGADGFGGPEGDALGRVHQPAHEIVSLQDYRVRHRQYKSDPASRAMHAAHPLIAIWDDHETANNAWEGGAENHQPETEGAWAARCAAAMQAYYEYMPVREPAGRGATALYRAYSWGDLATLVSIETRLTARVEEISLDTIAAQFTTREEAQGWYDTVRHDEGRYLLGAEQLDFVTGALGASKAAGQPWRVLLNQVLMATACSADLSPYTDEDKIAAIEAVWPEVRSFIAISAFELPVNFDAWDGYPMARARLYGALRDKGVSDLVVLTGDTHEWWANDLYAEDGRKMGVELGAPGVTSPGAGAYVGEISADLSLLATQHNPMVRYHSGMARGYIALELTRDKGAAEFISVSTITEPSYEARVLASFELRREDDTVTFGKAAGLGLKQTVLYREGRDG